jgi:[acyl-carrier-protein] S-malonyltransferase
VGRVRGAVVTVVKRAPVAFLFPGQGSQAVGMGADLAREAPVCRRTFEEADDALGFPISKLCFEGPEGDLTLTANTQPAILTVSVAIDRLLAERGVRPAFAAGHSLGEYSALVSAGVLSFRDAVRSVRLRGAAMQEAVAPGDGAMAAILALDPDVVAEICRGAAGSDVVSPANFNSPEQTVVAGSAGAVGRVCEAALARGARRAVPLAVSAPFHCALMRPAEARLAEHLASVRFADPAFPVVCNVTAAPIESGAQAREALVRQVCSPVRWTESVRTLVSLGAALFVEVGPGRVLSGLLKRIEKGAEAMNAEDVATVGPVLARLVPAEQAAVARGGRAASPEEPS